MTVDPPLGVCPEHPDRAAWRSCTRCGRFLCALCTQPSAQGPFCAACFALRPKKRKRWPGLLALPFLSLIASPIVLAFQLTQAWEATGGDWHLLSWEWLPELIPPAIAVFTLPQFVLQRKRAPLWMVAFYGVGVALDAVELAIAHSSPQPNPLGTSDSMPTEAIGIGVRVLWMLYFLYSSDVKQTFVR